MKDLNMDYWYIDKGAQRNIFILLETFQVNGHISRCYPFSVAISLDQTSICVCAKNL